MSPQDLERLAGELFQQQGDFGTTPPNAAGWAAASWFVLASDDPALTAEERLVLESLAEETLRGEAEGQAFLQQLAEVLETEDRLRAILVHVEGWHAQSRTQVGGPAARGPLPHHSRIGGFEVLEPLAKGGMGHVLRGRQISLDRPVALKVLPSSLQENEKFVDRFRKEARAAAKLRHPNIVQVIEAGHCEDSGAEYIAFELIEGRTAKELLASEGPLEEARALRIARCVAEALACAEEANIVHRDIKPSNILVGADGVAKVADLGVAKYRGENSRLTTQGLVIGTPHYIAPEQALAVDDIDIRADLYSLGISLFLLVSGKLPFSSPTPMGIISLHVSADVPDVRDVAPEVSEQTAKLIGHLCARVRDLRYGSAKEAARNIARVLAGNDPQPPGKAPEPAEPERPRIVSGHYDEDGLAAEG